jgi:hypothetical protein
MSGIILALTLLGSLFSGLYWFTYAFTLKGLAARPLHRSFYVNASTQSKLLSLVRGDWSIALTIIDLVRRQYPDRSEQWVWDRTIWYLERSPR